MSCCFAASKRNIAGSSNILADYVAQSIPVDVSLRKSKGCKVGLKRQRKNGILVSSEYAADAAPRYKAH